MSGSEEETYSIMFSSLKHPARRKILRMLSNKQMTYSEMLEALAIPSSHLTYHLENLGELVIKSEDGKYKLSSFGKASVSMMQGAEEVPDIHASRFSALPIRWKYLFAILMIGVVILASLSTVQILSFNQLSNNYAGLQQQYQDIKKQNDQLLSWTSSASEAMVILKNVAQLDVSKYQASLVGSPTVEVRTDLGGAIEEVSQYSLVSTVNRLQITIRYRNNEFSLFKMEQIEGAPNFPPLYTETQPTDDIQAAKALLERYQTATNQSYIQDMITLLGTANSSTTDEVLRHTRLLISTLDGNTRITLQYTASGVDFVGKTLHINLQDHCVTEFEDEWALYTIGTNELNISQDHAIQIAKEAVKDYKWTVNGTQVSDFTVLDSPITAEFYPHTRPENSVILFPYWYVTLHLDKTYPGNVNVIAVGVWADNGEVSYIQALSAAS
jgi:hypothetical protein